MCLNTEMGLASGQQNFCSDWHKIFAVTDMKLCNGHNKSQISNINGSPYKAILKQFCMTYGMVINGKQT